MLTVIIPTRQSERALVPTLKALIPGAVSGLVATVILADARSTDGTAAIADAAGCITQASDAPLAARLRAAAAAARTPWLLFLRPGFVPEPFWVDETARFLETAGAAGDDAAQAAMFRAAVPAFAYQSAMRSAAALVWRAITRPVDPDRGLLISAALYRECGGHRDGVRDPETDLMRRIGLRRIAVLPCGGFAPVRRQHV